MSPRKIEYGFVKLSVAAKARTTLVSSFRHAARAPSPTRGEGTLGPPPAHKR